MTERGVLHRRREALEHEWARWVPAARTTEPDVRPEVVDSWRRSMRFVDPARDSAPVIDGVDEQWASSPLRAPVSDLADELHTIAEDAGFVAAVTDESGTILWTCGGRVMRRRAESVNFSPGGRWDEPAMGTNALSLTLRTGRPATVFSAEHLVAALHGWVCYCAPIRSPRGRTLGVLDLSTTWDRSHPLAISTVRTLVSSIETRLRVDGLDIAPVGLALNALGEGELLHDGAPVPLRPRQIEILALLTLEPNGFSPERLRDAIYGDRPVSATTLKAEVSHLRHALGGGLSSRRYALTTPISCDAVEVLRALQRGDTTSAVRAYRGPLLPASDAPAVAEWREHLEVALREAVLASASAEHALCYGERAPYDAEVHEHALRLLAAGDARRALAAGRLAIAQRA